MKLHSFTARWWEELLRTEGRLEKWLQRLWQAESQGAARFQSIVDAYQPFGEALEALTGIIADERAHARLVEEVLIARSIDIPEELAPERYWNAVWPGVSDFRTACAAGARGEMLARNRFRVILEHRDTPEDVRVLVGKILPDEERHASVLGALAGRTGMYRMRIFHLRGMLALGLNIADAADD